MSITCAHRGIGAEQNVMRWCVRVHVCTSVCNHCAICYRIITQAKKSRSPGLTVVKLEKMKVTAFWLVFTDAKFALTTFTLMNRRVVGQAHAFGHQRGVVSPAALFDSSFFSHLAATFIGCVPRRPRIFFHSLRLLLCLFWFSSLDSTFLVVSITKSHSFIHQCISTLSSKNFLSVYTWQWLSHYRPERWIRASGCHQGGLGRVGYWVV